MFSIISFVFLWLLVSVSDVSAYCDTAYRGCGASSLPCSAIHVGGKCPNNANCVVVAYNESNCWVNAGMIFATATCCSRACELDSITCAAPNVWNSTTCACDPPPLPPPPDFTWHCQNTGGPTPGGFGAPPTADLYQCENKSGESGQVCVLKRKLHGTCQDWGFCKDGVEDCHIDPEKGNPPCGRSGEPFTTSPRCYYACADGTDLSCKPVSTQYVAGAIYKGECPGDPPEGCRPESSSSGSSSSGVAVSSSSYGTTPDDWRDTVPNSPGGSQPPQIDYTRILAAIHDTLHRANEQREFLMELDNNISFDVDNISNYTEYIYNQESAISSGVSGINNKLTSFQENGFSLVSETAQDISNSRQLLDEINSYLRSDSLYSREPDTVYNPLLRDIKGAIDSINVNVALDSGSTLFSRDSAFSRWWSNYMADTAQSNGVVGRLYEDVKRAVGDSVKNASCARFMACYSKQPTFSNSQACASSVGVTLEQCSVGGSPLDVHLNVAEGILKTIWNAIFGDDSTEVSISPVDSAVSFSPAMSQAFQDVEGAKSGLSLDSLSKTIQDVKARVDSARARKNDSVKIQPDSLWLDTAQAKQYVQTLLLPSGTGTDCFICHADLGNFGGLARENLSIHIDFSNFGGYNFCEIVRVIIKIATLVTCISLTLGSWAAAFGYNPKNDA